MCCQFSAVCICQVHPLPKRHIHASRALRRCNTTFPSLRTIHQHKLLILPPPFIMKRATLTIGFLNIALFGASLGTHSGPPFPGSVPEVAPLYLRSSDVQRYSVQRRFKGSRPSARSVLLTSESEQEYHREARSK